MRTWSFTEKADWLEERKNSLGASEVGILTGDNPYQSRKSLLAQHLSGKQKDLSRNMRVLAGIELERLAVRHMVTELPDAMVTTPTMPWTLCRNEDDFPLWHWSPDAFVWDRYQSFVPGEAKATGLSKDWEAGGTPRIYWAQCQVAMAVSESYRAYLCAIINPWDRRSDDYALRVIERHHDWIERAYALTVEFWEELQATRNAV